MTGLFDSIDSLVSSTISVWFTAGFRRSTSDLILTSPRDFRRIGLRTASRLARDGVPSEWFKFPAGVEVKSRAGETNQGLKVVNRTTITTLSGLPVPDSRLWRSGPTLDEAIRFARTWYILPESLAFCSATLEYETRLLFCTTESIDGHPAGTKWQVGEK